MDNAYARVGRFLTLAALLSASLPITARPLLVPPKQRLSVPRLIQEQSPGLYPTYYGLAAIDGDTLLVNARRVMNSDGVREEGVHLFQRGADGAWAYVNGDLKISAKDQNMTGGGTNAILMYKTAADFYHYIAYQP